MKRTICTCYTESERRVYYSPFKSYEVVARYHYNKLATRELTGQRPFGPPLEAPVNVSGMISEHGVSANHERRSTPHYPRLSITRVDQNHVRPPPPRLCHLGPRGCLHPPDLQRRHFGRRGFGNYWPKIEGSCLCFGTRVLAGA